MQFKNVIFEMLPPALTCKLLTTHRRRTKAIVFDGLLWTLFTIQLYYPQVQLIQLVRLNLYVGIADIVPILIHSDMALVLTSLSYQLSNVSSEASVGNQIYIFLWRGQILLIWALSKGITLMLHFGLRILYTSGTQNAKEKYIASKIWIWQ